jgi:hypothetical protein
MIDKLALLATCLFIVALATWPPSDSSSKTPLKAPTNYKFESQMDSLHNIDSQIDLKIKKTFKKALINYDRKH